MDLGLSGRRALVTAASKGLGRACAAALSAEGASVYIAARGREALERTAKDINAAGFQTADVSQPEVPGALVEAAGVIRGSARIDGRVDGSLIVLSGNAWLGPQAVVGRDVYVLGGRLETSPGAVVGGKALSIPSLTVLVVLAPARLRVVAPV